MSRSASWFLLVVGLAGLLLARESRQPSGGLAGVDRAFLDWLAANTKPTGASARAASETPAVTLVEIDDSVLDTPGRLPLPALEYASFLQIVQRYDPAVVAIEPVLDWTHSAPGTEQILLDQALTVPRLLLAVQLGGDVPAGRDPADMADSPPSARSPGARARWWISPSWRRPRMRVSDWSRRRAGRSICRGTRPRRCAMCRCFSVCATGWCRRLRCKR